MVACGSGARTAPAAPLASTTACTPFGPVDGSTFESVGIGEPIVINPATGANSMVYFRFCKDRYEYLYVARDAIRQPAKSHASVIHSRTVASTSSGPRRFTT